jgi:hypothetical protein
MEGKIVKIDGNVLHVKLLKAEQYNTPRCPQSMMDNLSKYKISEDDKYVVVKTHLSYYNPKNGPLEEGLGIGFNPSVLATNNAVQIEHCASYEIPEDEDVWITKYVKALYV